jgi:hypothetical protein
MMPLSPTGRSQEDEIPALETWDPLTGPLSFKGTRQISIDAKHPGIGELVFRSRGGEIIIIARGVGGTLGEDVMKSSRCADNLFNGAYSFSSVSVRGGLF